MLKYVFRSKDIYNPKTVVKLQHYSPTATPEQLQRV